MGDRGWSMIFMRMDGLHRGLIWTLLRGLRMDRVSASSFPPTLYESSTRHRYVGSHDGSDPRMFAGMTDETFEEIETYFEMIDSRLSFKGFMQLYQLQAENDEEETSKDLEAWGYDLETLVLKQKVVEGNKKGGIEMGKEVGKGKDVKEN
jgi:hypothetical protein